MVDFPLPCFVFWKVSFLNPFLCMQKSLFRIIQVRLQIHWYLFHGPLKNHQIPTKRASTCWSQLQSHFHQRSSGHGASRNLSESKNLQQIRHSNWTTRGPGGGGGLGQNISQLGSCTMSASRPTWILSCWLRNEETVDGYVQAKSAAPVEFIKQLKEVIHETTQCIGPA